MEAHAVQFAIAEPSRTGHDSASGSGVIGVKELTRNFFELVIQKNGDSEKRAQPSRVGINPGKSAL